MWPFRRKTEEETPSRRFQDRLETVEDTLHGVVRDVKTLRLDAEAMYEKTMRLHQRVSKRAQREELDVVDPIPAPEVDLNALIKAGKGIPGHQNHLALTRHVK